MRVAVAREVRPGERRVALTAEAAAPLVSSGVEVVVESGAGAAALSSDAAFRDVGVEIVEGGDVLADADVVLHVRPLLPAEIGRLRRGAVTIGFMTPSAEPDGVRLLRDAGVTAFSMELVPRISRAQSMDA